MYVEIGYKYLNKDGNERMFRKVYGDENSFMSKYETMKQKSGNVDLYIGAYGHDVYPIAKKGQKLPPYKLHGDMYFDVDVDGAASEEEAYNTARDEAVAIVEWVQDRYHIPASMMEIYYSGSKGFHVFAPTEDMGLGAHEQLNDIFHYVAIQIKQDVAPHVDTKIYDRKRILRAEGSINSKTGLYKVPITFNQLKEYDMDQLKEWASEPHELIRTEPKMTLWSKASLQAMVNSDKWKNTTSTKKDQQSLPNDITSKKSSIHVGTGMELNRSTNDRVEAVKVLDSSFFHNIINPKYDGLTMSIDSAKVTVKSEISMEELVGMSNSFSCVLHNDDNPSASILPPNFENGYKDWIYYCRSNNCEYGGVSLDNIGLVRALSGKSFMDCLRFLCDILGIHISYDGSRERTREVREMVAANHAVLQQIASQSKKRNHLLNRDCQVKCVN